MKKVGLVFTALIVISNLAFAAPYSRDVTIESLHPMAVDRVHCASCSGVTRVYVNSASWGDSNCRTDAADLAFEDTHILSILMAAWVAGKKVKIEVNDTEKPVDQVCRITAAWAYK